jgi:cytochrome b561
MSLATKHSSHVQRIWKTPTSRTAWLWLAVALILCGILGAIFFYTLKTQQYPGPYYDPLRLFGIVSFLLVLITIAYTLRRRFVRQLPGKVQNWLWIHTWFGIAAIIIALWHANFTNIYPTFYLVPSTFIEGNAGMSALYGLLLLVITGIIGRFLDTRLARVIAHEANSNGVGIALAVEERLHELELTIGRLSAGKPAAFKNYCTQVLRGTSRFPGLPPTLSEQEQEDFQRAWDALSLHTQLIRSLRRQQRARSIIQGWRYIHITLACLGFAAISLHSLLELAKLALQLLGKG